MKYQEELDFIQEAVVDAYKKNQHPRHYQCDEKGPTDLVTSTDFAIEKTLIKMINERFPDDKILSEETQNETMSGGRMWTIDPIDGTYNFASGIPLFGVQACLLEDDRPVVSAVYLPLLHELYYAALGGGAFLFGDNTSLLGDKIKVKQTPLHRAVLSFGDYQHLTPEAARAEQSLLVKLPSKIGRVRMLGAACIDFAYVASGKTQGTILYTKNKWDIMPGILLCQEAGALVYGDSGEYRTDSEFIIAAASKEVVDSMMAVIEKDKKDTC